VGEKLARQLFVTIDVPNGDGLDATNQTDRREHSA
jgi:hypothetical protein